MLRHLTQEQVDRVISAANELNAVDRPSEEGIRFPGDLELHLKQWKQMQPQRAALRAAIAALPLEARFELMALMWVGRGDVPDATFDNCLEHARRSADEGDVNYIAEKSPSLPMYLRDGLAKLRHSSN